MNPFSLGNIILLKEKGGRRESIPRQIDKKFRAPNANAMKHTGWRP